MKNNGTELMTFLKEMFRYDDNFTIYLQDILSIDEIYFEAVKGYLNADLSSLLKSKYTDKDLYYCLFYSLFLTIFVLNLF